jgi:hypothetical protein
MLIMSVERMPLIQLPIAEGVAVRKRKITRS